MYFSDSTSRSLMSFHPSGIGRADDAWPLRVANEVSRVIPEAMVLAMRGRVSRRGLRGRPREWEEVRREGSMRYDGILCMHPRTIPPGLLLCFPSTPPPPPRPLFGGTLPLLRTLSCCQLSLPSPPCFPRQRRMLRRRDGGERVDGFIDRV